MRRVILILLFLGAGAAVAFLLNRRAGHGSGEDPPVSRGETDHRSAAPNVSPGAKASNEHADAGVDDTEAQPFHFDLAELDFEALRQQTPDSLYWSMAAPSEDPAVLEERARVREERNRQYGKVVSNTATVEEIHDYFAYRRQLSEDYIEVVQLILDGHGDELSERDTGLFELAISMHSARLAEIPAKLDDALQRKTEYDRVKKDWQEQRRREGGNAP